MENKKPLGILLIVSANAFLGAMLVPVGYVTTAVATEVRGAPDHAGWYGTLSLLLGMFLLASAYGLWTQRPWSRYFTMGVELIMIPVSSVGLVSFYLGAKVPVGNAIASVVGIALSIAVMEYLAREEIGSLYQAEGGSARPPAERFPVSVLPPLAGRA